MDFVLDTSITLAWCFQDEATPATHKLLEKLATTSAFVPMLWSLEVGNSLISAKRHKRITYAGITQFLSMKKLPAMGFMKFYRWRMQKA